MGIESQVDEHLSRTLSEFTTQQAAPLEEVRREAAAARAVAQRALDDLATVQEAQERLLATVWQHESLLQQLDARFDTHHRDPPSPLEAKLEPKLEAWVQSTLNHNDAAHSEAMRAEVARAQGEVEARLMVHMTTLQGEIAGKLWDETCLDARLEQMRRDLGRCIMDMHNSVVQDLSELGLAPSTMKIKVVAPPERKYSV